MTEIVFYLLLLKGKSHHVHSMEYKDTHWVGDGLVEAAVVKFIVYFQLRLFAFVFEQVNTRPYMFH